ncbi:MAG TPA: 3D domain-containing protein [Pyrinomonadaceae bacterium]|nr:3D domain-containing protein [Pyrinomonadaceae bacterium]
MAEPLAATSQEPQGQPKTDAKGAQAPGEAVSKTEVNSAALTSPTETAPSETSEPSTTFTATAYSLRGRTASGKPVARGLIAADRRILPIGTRVRLQAGSYSGEYLVADTGGAVRGRKIDIWMPSTGEAMRFGRRNVKLTVLTRVRPRAARAKRAG